MPSELLVDAAAMIMPSPKLLRPCLFLAALLGLWSADARAEFAGPPRVIDGATIVVAGQRIRLWGIVAPPLGYVCRGNGHDFDCGAIARTQLLDLTAGSAVVCEPADSLDAAADEIVGMCMAGGFSINRNMVYTGWALADRTLGDRYVAIENEARQAKRGLWRWQFAPLEPGARGG